MNALATPAGDSGEPLDLHGPDISAAMPIEDLIGDLPIHIERGDPDTYAYWIIQAAEASGIAAVLTIEDDGPRLRLGMPFDDQASLRSARVDAIVEHVRKDPRRRDALIGYLQSRGQFTDARKFSTPADAVAAVRRLGGRLFIVDYGLVEMSLITDGGTFEREIDEGFPRKSVVHRWANTMRVEAFGAQMRDWLMTNGANLGDGKYCLRPEGEAA